MWRKVVAMGGASALTGRGGTGQCSESSLIFTFLIAMMAGHAEYVAGILY
ncbi:MAG: hypothetical protein ACJAUE_000167 [Alcanivorax sp.]|jgi:hypothetical protein